MVVDWIVFGMNVSADRILSRCPAQSCARVSTGVAPGGFISAVKATLLVFLAIVSEAGGSDFELGF